MRCFVSARSSPDAQANVFRPAVRVECVAICRCVLTMGPRRILPSAADAANTKGRTVKSLNQVVKRCDNRVVPRCSDDTVPNITITRRQNALALFQEYAAARIAAGEPAKGLEQSFAAQLEISPSMWSQVKASRPISDKLARQIESHTKKPAGWLDALHGAPQPDAAEERFLDLARAAWRASNAQAKRDLARLMRERASQRG